MANKQKVIIDKEKIKTKGKIKEKDINEILIEKEGDISSYEIIEVEGHNVTIDKNKLICDEFIEIE